MPVRQKSLAERSEKSDGIRVFIARYRPRGLPKGAESWDRWEKRLAPSAELLAEFHGKRRQGGKLVAEGLDPLTWEEYVPRFLAEMDGEEAKAALAALKQEVDEGWTITLLCHCKEAKHCHRTLVKKLLGSTPAG